MLISYLKQDSLEPLTTKKFFIRPFQEAKNNLSKIFVKTVLIDSEPTSLAIKKNELSKVKHPLKERIKHLVVGIALSIPFINSIVFLLLRTNEQEKVKKNDMNVGYIALINQAREDIPLIESANEILRKKIQFIDDFIKANPKLNKKVLKAAKSYTPVYSKYVPPDTSKFNPNNVFDKRCLLELEHVNLEAKYEERQLFVERNEEVYQAFHEALNKSHGDTFNWYIIKS